MFYKRSNQVYGSNLNGFENMHFKRFPLSNSFTKHASQGGMSVNSGLCTSLDTDRVSSGQNDWVTKL